MSHKIAYRVAHAATDTVKTSCIAVGVYEKQKLSNAAAQLDKASDGQLKRFLKKGDFSGRCGQYTILYDIPGIPAPRLLLVGCGANKQISQEDFQKIHVRLIKCLISLNATQAASYLHEVPVDMAQSATADPGWSTRQAVLACDHTLYQFDLCKALDKKRDKPKLKTLQLCQLEAEHLAERKQGAKQGQGIAEGINLAKTLGNLPGNICTPSYLAKQAKSLQKTFPSVKTTVLSEAAMEKLGMGSLLSVARGSQEPAKLAIMEYQQGKPGAKPIVLVGKGITFDSGGISLKPGAKMDEMKFDMCGAASVLGTLHACARIGVKANVIGIIACAENMPGGKASKPGDIVTSMSGRTIEILNTDAEGRLVLCDALSYAERYKPAAVIDIATLTGACIVALGRVPSGLLGNNEQLVQRLKQAGEQCGDRVWQLPLWPDYRRQLKSNFADVANIGGPDAGTITAAVFLSYFTENYPWAHLDIAGTAWKSNNDKGATGRPVSLLAHYILQNHAGKKV